MDIHAFIIPEKLVLSYLVWDNFCKYLKIKEIEKVAIQGYHFSLNKLFMVLPLKEGLLSLTTTVNTLLSQVLQALIIKGISFILEMSQNNLTAPLRILRHCLKM